MYKCSCGARFTEEGEYVNVSARIDGDPYREVFACCPYCGGGDYWEDVPRTEDEDAEGDS